jgi:hypothetical protein
MTTITPERMTVSNELAKRVLNHPKSRFSCCASASKFRPGDYCYFGSATYTMRGSCMTYKAELALRLTRPVDEEPEFIVVAVSGSYGFGGLQQAAKYTFSNRVKAQLFKQADLLLCHF